MRIHYTRVNELISAGRVRFLANLPEGTNPPPTLPHLSPHGGSPHPDVLHLSFFDAHQIKRAKMICRTTSLLMRCFEVVMLFNDKKTDLKVF